MIHSCEHGTYLCAWSTNPRVKSVDLHIHLVKFIVFQNHMVVGKYSPNIYASPQSTILWIWDLVSHVKYFQHSSSHVSHIIPGTTFGSDTILGHENSSHNLTLAHSCWHRTHPWAWAHKPTGQERSLVHTFGEVHCNLKPYGSRRANSSNIYAGLQPTIYRCEILSQCQVFRNNKQLIFYKTF